VDAAARGAGMSVNAWMVRAVGAALGTDRRRSDGRPPATSDNHFSGWVR
jgi:hypothetical protein